MTNPTPEPGRGGYERVGGDDAALRRQARTRRRRWAGLAVLAAGALAGVAWWWRSGGVRAWDTPEWEAAFREFESAYGRAYAPSERATRFEHFRRNAAHIHESNRAGPSHRLAINEFADRSPEEIRQLYGLRHREHKERDANNKSVQGWVQGVLGHDGSLDLSTYAGGVPSEFDPDKVGTVVDSTLGHIVAEGTPEETVDWRKAKTCRPLVKNQAQCGSCYSFSAMTALETAICVGTGTYRELSEQQIVDCGESFGCNGGNYEVSWAHARRAGLCSARAYPYESGADNRARACREARCAEPAPPFEVFQLARHEAWVRFFLRTFGPVSVALQADERVWPFYRSGVVSACAGPINHAVLAVGYGVDAGTPYWLVQNSWGPAWGDGGFIKLRRGATAQYDTCSILCDPAIPITDQVLKAKITDFIKEKIEHDRDVKAELPPPPTSMPYNEDSTEGGEEDDPPPLRDIREEPPQKEPQARKRTAPDKLADARVPEKDPYNESRGTRTDGHHGTPQSGKGPMKSTSDENSRKSRDRTDRGRPDRDDTPTARGVPEPPSGRRPSNFQVGNGHRVRG